MDPTLTIHLHRITHLRQCLRTLEQVAQGTREKVEIRGGRIQLHSRLGNARPKKRDYATARQAPKGVKPASQTSEVNPKSQMSLPPFEPKESRPQPATVPGDFLARPYGFTPINAYDTDDYLPKLLPRHTSPS